MHDTRNWSTIGWLVLAFEASVGSVARRLFPHLNETRYNMDVTAFRIVTLAILMSGAALAVVGCGDDPAPRVESHSARISPGNALIAEVSITLDRDGFVFVEYENEEAGKFRTARSEDPASEHVVSALRLRPSTTYSYTVVSTDGEGNESRSGAGEFTTGDLPLALSTLRIDARGTPSSELLLLDHREIEGSYFFMLDGDARIVWYYESPNPFEDVPYPTGGTIQKPNFNLVYHLNNPFNICCIREITPTGRIVDNLAAGPVNGYPHRALTSMPDGRILYAAWTYRVIDDTDQGGEAETLVEGLSLRAWDQETGLTEELWNAFDGIGTDVRGGWGVGTIASYPNEVTLQEHTPPIRWTGANSLQIGPRENIIVSIPNLSQVISISPDFQRVEWSLGGSNSTFTFEDPSDRFYRQHTAQQLSNGNILMFDNGRDRPEEEGGNYSRALELALNDYDLVARKVWEYRHDPDLYAVNRSSAYRLGNGNTLLNFVTDPRVVVEVAPDGAEVFKAEISGPRMQGSFRAYALDSVMGETRVVE